MYLVHKVLRIAYVTNAKSSQWLRFAQYIKTVVRGYNIIATIRGANYGTLHDKIIVVMAHYDTHSSGTPGVDDNGSGVSALLEVARLLTKDDYCTRYFLGVYVLMCMCVCVRADWRAYVYVREWVIWSAYQSSIFFTIPLRIHSLVTHIDAYLPTQDCSFTTVNISWITPINL